MATSMMGTPDLRPVEDAAPSDADRRRDAEILRVARQRWGRADTHESPWRQLAQEDRRFSVGKQWGDAGELRRREERVCLTINQMPKFLRQVTNEQRQTRAGIHVRAVDSVSDPDTAAMIQGLIRHIEYQSDADIAYDTAFDAAVRTGRGYWRVTVDYTDPYSLTQTLKIGRILNENVVYVDPAGRWTPDYHGMDWAFIVGQMSRDEFCQLYEVSGGQYAEWQATGDGWLTKDEVRVAEYFYRERWPVLLVQLPDRSLRYTLDRPPAHPGMDLPAPSPELLPLIQRKLQARGIAALQPQEYGLLSAATPQRVTQIPLVWWLKITGTAILDRTVWPGESIPIIPVFGEEVVVDEEIDYRGIVRDARDAQRMYNYWATCEAETITLAPKAPYVGAEGQFEGQENAWKQANVKNFGYLQYKPVSLNGVVVPPPQRQAVEPPIQAITIARQQAEHDLHATTGIYPPALGQRSNETSGRAIRARQQQSQIGNFHFFGNFMRALRRTGRILLECIPHVYAEEQVVQILGEDETQQRVLLRPGATPQAQQAQGALPDGVAGIYDVTVGQYDVVIDSGPSYATKRTEAAEGMAQMVQAYPELMRLGGDILLQNQDWPGADDLAQRLKKTIPPEVLEHAEGDPAQHVQQLQAHVQQTAQQLQALNAYAEQCEQALRQTQQELEGLKAQQALKHAEVAMKQQAGQQEAQLQQLEVELKHAELAVKREEIRVKQQEIALERRRLDLESANMQKENRDAGSDDADAERTG